MPLVNICTSGRDPLSLSTLLKRITHCLTGLTSTVWSPEMCSKCQWMSMGAIFSCMEELNTFASYILPSQTTFCQTARCHTARKHNDALVGRSNLSVILPTSTSDIMGQENTWGITFVADLVTQKKALGRKIKYILKWSFKEHSKNGMVPVTSNCPFCA